MDLIMNINPLFNPPNRRKTWLVLALFLIILLGAEILASQVQQDFGRVAVSNVTYSNETGIPIRAKLLQPVGLSAQSPGPGVVYIHGYQNNRETSDAYAIEIARRGIVVLEIDAIGRGNSGNPLDLADPAFDPTFGGQASFEYLKSLPFVDLDAVGLMGHSLGAEMVYTIALSDPAVKGLVISGFAYRADATPTNPPNMLMIFGQYDEYRERMTGVRDVRAEWLSSPQTAAAFGPFENLEFGVTYGQFETGSARKVVLLPVVHLLESHHRYGVAAAVDWMQSALKPDPNFWIPAESQIWEIKEYATLVALFAGIFSVLPVAVLLLGTPYFSGLRTEIATNYACSRRELYKHAALNGALMWLYLPLIMALFGLHVYVVQIDKAFPMMLVNGTVWWFVWINVIGFFILRRWFRRKHHDTGLVWADLGISFDPYKFALDIKYLGKTALLGFIIFGYAYALEHILEAIFIVDYRFLFPFASDLTVPRWGLWLLYFPFLMIGFLQMGFFLHGQIRIAPKDTWLKTFWVWSQVNTLVMLIPLMLFLLVQYVPLFTIGTVPFVGPGGVLANFTMSLFHILGVLIIIVPIQTGLFQLTGRPYLGAIVNAALVAWMFTSSQVIAPIPV
jgi:uncharacterized protein